MNSKLGKKFGTGVIVLLITFCFIPAPAGASAPCDGRDGRGFDGKGPHRPALGIWRHPQMGRQLELTETQIKQLKDADFTFREKRLALKAQLDRLHLQMEKMFSEDSVDETACLNTAQKMSDVKSKMFVQQVESRLALGKILNADQIKKLEQHGMHQRKRGLRKGNKHGSGRYPIEIPGDEKSFEN